jgi:hypothetical protein
VWGKKMGSGLGEVILAFGGLAWWLRPEWELGL